MRSIVCAILISLSITLLVMPAQKASAMSGNELLKAYKMSEGGTESNFAGGIVLGMIIGVSTITQGKYHCRPTKVTNGQLSDIVFKYLKDHPEKLHENASLVIAMAYIEAFPCE
jgi:hypothetical protein